MGQSSPITSSLINFVVVIDQGFVSMAGNLNDFVPWLSGSKPF